MAGTYSFDASEQVRVNLGFYSYKFGITDSMWSFDALDKNGSAVTNARLYGDKLDTGISMDKLAANPALVMNGRKSHSEASGRWGNVRILHELAPVGTQAVNNFIKNGIPDMLTEFRAIGQDVAQAAASQSSGQVRAHKPIDAFCLIAGAGVGFWPIGTALAGPTFVGCVVYYWKSP